MLPGPTPGPSTLPPCSTKACKSSPPSAKHSPEPVQAHILPCEGHTLGRAACFTQERRERVCQTPRRQAQPDTWSRGETEHGKKVLAIHSLPPGQTVGSAVALRRNRSTQFSCWVPGLACGDPGQPHTSRQGYGHHYCASRSPAQQAGWSGGQASRERACTLHPAQPRTHWGISRSYTPCLPKTKPHKGFRTVQCTMGLDKR